MADSLVRHDIHDIFPAFLRGRSLCHRAAIIGASSLLNMQGEPCWLVVSSRNVLLSS